MSPIPEVQPDGSFRIEDVRPGTFVLTGTLQNEDGAVLGKIRREIRVSEPESSQPPAPIDMGQVMVR